MNYIGVSEIIGYAVMTLSLSLVFFTMRSRREGELEGRMTFAQAFYTGVVFSLVAATLFGVGTTLLYTWMGEAKTLAFMEAYIQHNAGTTATPDDLQKARDAFEAQKHLWLNPLFQGATMLGTVFPLGAMVSLFWSFFARKR
jgi:hypothetical protein